MTEVIKFSSRSTKLIFFRSVRSDWDLGIVFIIANSNLKKKKIQIATNGNDGNFALPSTVEKLQMHSNSPTEWWVSMSLFADSERLL